MRDASLRQSGRTTRMLIEAHDAKVLGERILIIAPNSSVMEQLMRLARNLGIMNGGVQPKPLLKQEFTTTHHVAQGRRLRGFRGVLFEDHTVQEFSPPIAYSREVRLWQATIPKPITWEPIPPPQFVFKPF